MTRDDPMEPIPLPPGGHGAVRVPAAEGLLLEGDLARPGDARGLVVFAHGSGSSRHSPRNRAVAEVLQRAGLATFLFDLLTDDEERADARTGHLRFDIDLLARRVVAAVDWTRNVPALASLHLGLFGASTGAAAALVAAARRPEAVEAVVSRGGRPDLAAGSLEAVRAPTLLLVGALDTRVIAMNEDAARQLRVEHRLEIVPGATHLFEEPGTLDDVARHAAAWFVRHLGGRPARVGAPPGAPRVARPLHASPSRCER